MTRNPVDPAQLGQVVMGTVIANLATSNVARDAALGAGIPESVPAVTVTQACVSSNQAITLAASSILTGHAGLAIAGGAESMTDIPIRYRKRLRDKLVESRRYKGVLDYFKFFRGLRPSDLLPEIPAIEEFSTGRSMGEDCDRLCARIGVSRVEQDEFAYRSHRLAHRAAEEGVLAGELEPVRLPPDFQSIDRDNGVRSDTTLEKLGSLKPAFVKPHGTVTAGNSSFLTDGAAAVLLASEEAATEAGMQPKARIREFAYSAQDPDEELLLGPAYATPRVLERAGLSLQDIDVFEFHEAFAGQVLANLKCLASPSFGRDKLGLAGAVGEVPMDRLNLWGGSLSLGHPFGATGARLVTTAVNRLRHEDGELALVASCAAGAIGSAIVLERLN